MQSDTDGRYVKPFFSDYHREKRATGSKTLAYSYIQKREIENNTPICNCPVEPLIENTFTLDHSDSKSKPLLIFVDSKTHDIVAADKMACRCHVLANIGMSNWPLKNLESDFGTIYWIDSANKLHYLSRNNQSFVNTLENVTAVDISIFGSHTQPYPKAKCLVPQNNQLLNVDLMNKTPNSLQLRMPTVEIVSECKNSSAAPIEYFLYYAAYGNQMLNCDKSYHLFSTFDEIVIVKGLKPFTKYVFCLSVANYFSKIMERDSMINQGVMFQTAAGGKILLITF